MATRGAGSTPVTPTKATPPSPASPLYKSPIDGFGELAKMPPPRVLPLVAQTEMSPELDRQENAIVLAARQLKTRLNDYLVEPTMEELRVSPGAKPIRYHVLLEKLDHAFRRQHEINKTNAQLNVVQYVASISTLARNRQLQRAIHVGQLRIRDLESNMAQQCDSILNLESAVRTVDTEVADQKAKTDELEYALTELEAQLARNMEEYKVEMSAQKLLLEEQSAIIAKLSHHQVNHDVFIEGSILVCTGIFVNLTLVDYPLGFLTSLILRSGSPRRRVAARQLSKLLMFFLIFVWLRKKASQFGLHSGVGSFASFAGNGLMSYIGWQ